MRHSQRTRLATTIMSRILYTTVVKYQYYIWQIFLGSGNFEANFVSKFEGNVTTSVS